MQAPSGCDHCGVALTSALAPALGPAILTLGGDSYRVLFGVAGACAVLGAAAILPVKGVR